MILQGDCVEVMRTLAPESVDAIVTDPPYGLEFMGKEWDKLCWSSRVAGPNAQAWRKANKQGGWAAMHEAGTPRFNPTKQSTLQMQAWHQAWATEALRVLKPGGYLLAFGGTRTYHRLACAIEDAGFEVRDCLSWMYASGFPKSLDVSKAIDKAAGKKRERIDRGRGPGLMHVYAQDAWTKANSRTSLHPDPLTDDAATWQGWGTALKPAWEPIVMARKPLIGTVAANVLAHGTGAINVDGCRIEGGGNRTFERSAGGRPRDQYRTGTTVGAAKTTDTGRWPANVVLSHTPECREVGTRKVKSNGRFPAALTGRSMFGLNGHTQAQGSMGDTDANGTETVSAWECSEDCPVRMLDEQSGERRAGTYPGRTARAPKFNGTTYNGGAVYEGQIDAAPRTLTDTGGASRFFFTAKASSAERSEGLSKRNTHPTVKPVALMTWLVRMVTPPGGTVLDPFLGSGSTAVAAVGCGFEWIGIERDPEYVAIAEQRLGLFGLTA